MESISESIKNILAVLVNYGTEQLNYLEQVVSELKSFKKYDVSISALKKNNIKLLKKLISERLSTNINTSNFIITSQRQLLCFKSAVTHLLKAKKIKY